MYLYLLLSPSLYQRVLLDSFGASFNFYSISVLLTRLCCLCCDPSDIHDPFVLYFSFLLDFSRLEVSLSSCSVSCTTIKSLHVSFPNWQRFSKLYTPLSYFLICFSVQSLLLFLCYQPHLIYADSIHIEAYTLHASLPFFTLFLTLCWWKDLLIFPEEILGVFLEARLVFDRGLQGSHAPGRQTNK